MDKYWYQKKKKYRDKKNQSWNMKTEYISLSKTKTIVG